MTTERLPPLPLTDAAGRIFAYACAHCLDVGSIPGIGGGTINKNREARAKASLRDAERCGECYDCKGFDPRHRERRLTCAACDAKRAARPSTGEMVPCPDCAGTGSFPATTPDGRSVTADCAACDGDGEVWQPFTAP